jgi:chitin disaccharide deacetylase
MQSRAKLSIRIRNTNGFLRSPLPLIINADDFGRSAAETDAAYRCYVRGRVTSLSAMVFMDDSHRAAALAEENQLDVGLHLNFTEPFAAKDCPSKLKQRHQKVARYLNLNKYTQLLYNPFLVKDFGYTYTAQFEEFIRLFRKAPSHLDGHHHMHLCANILFSNLIQAGTKLRRNFSFWPGEKSILNRTYRSLIDRWLTRKYQLPDYFFDLTRCIEGKTVDRVVALAKSSSVELMTHPVMTAEAEYLMTDEFGELLQRLDIGSYALV